MKKYISSLMCIGLPFVLFTAAACDGETADALDLESRSGYVEEAAEEACDRISDCGEIGEDKDYNTYDDCVVEKTEDFNSLWPSDECDGERINGAKFDSCMARIEAMACDGFASLADNAAFAAECGADDVCIDD